MEAVKAVQALPALSEINALIESADQDAAKARAEEITKLLKEARELYSYILDETQLAYFTGDYDGNNYETTLLTTEEAMKPVKTHFGIVTLVSGIELISAPTKLTYTEGETLDFTGLSIKVLYDDGSEKYVTAEDCTFSITTASKSNTRVNVYYSEDGGTRYSKYFRITVNSASSETPVTPDNPGNSTDSSSSSSSGSNSGSSSSDSSSSGDASAEKAGLPGGAIAGIVIGGVVVLLAGGFAVYYFVIRKKLH
jgi:hypothetical protein